MGNWPIRGTQGGRCFLLPPFFGPWACDNKSKKLEGCNFGNPPFWAPRGHLPFFAVLDSWASADHLDQPNTYRYQPNASKLTYLGANPNWTRSLASPSPTLGAIYTKVTQPMARESYTSSSLGVTETPHRSGVRPPSSLLHHEAKEQVQFLSTPRYALTTDQRRIATITERVTVTKSY